ncbi:S24 family peptidase [Chitinophaga pendula]|uniref:S24 family peptidase n=1 Tax=Chitinophaga TaxID=79328 RepID=UPI000BAF708D|nr:MULTISPECIES: S24 family peptidase [Chitinophaga]ASZ11069.1 hypothetical protein CK934_08905 [Chitinophaga sp. MD30]UCJ05933.1 S24 family peptidase [Chitinophaga pendula]
MTVNQRVKKIIDDLYSGNKRAFATAIGVAPTVIENIVGTRKGNPSFDVCQKIISANANISTDWLITGIGEMLKGELIKAPEGRFKRHIRADREERIAFYETDFEAGKGVAFYDDIRHSEPAYYMDVPDFAGCTAFRTYGKSMQPQIEPGAILFGTKEEDWQEYLEYGQIYGIVLSDSKRLLKQIKKSKKSDEYFLLISANPEFDEFEIPKSKVKNLWLIHGWLNKNT